MRESILMSVLVCILLVVSTAWAAPKVDEPKPADEALAWQVKAKFSTLHEEKASGFLGYGSYQEAQSILEDALCSEPADSPQDEFSHEKFNHFMAAARNARQACGSADKYRRLIEVLMQAGMAISSCADGATALRGGCEFLVNGGGQSMTKSILALGLSMVRERLSSCENGCKICMRAITVAIREADSENEQWASILRFSKIADQKCGSWSNRYKTMRTICKTVIDAQQGQTVYMRALVNISRAGLSNSEDLYKVMMAGFKEYENNVPSKSHKALASFVITTAEKAKSLTDGLTIMVAAAEKMQTGKGLSGNSNLGSTEDR